MLSYASEELPPKFSWLHTMNCIFPELTILNMLKYILNRCTDKIKFGEPLFDWVKAVFLEREGDFLISVFLFPVLFYYDRLYL